MASNLNTINCTGKIQSDHPGNVRDFEKLFLFEFLIDHVILYNSKLGIDDDFLLNLGAIVVKFQFLNYPSIEICEEDFTPSTKPLLEEKRTLLKSGKSCMFSLSSIQQNLDNAKFEVFLNVYRKNNKVLFEKWQREMMEAEGKGNADNISEESGGETAKKSSKSGETIRQDGSVKNGEGTREDVDIVKSGGHSEKLSGSGEKAATDEENYFIGATKINLSDNFKHLLEQSTCNNNTHKLAHTKTAALTLFNANGYSVGKIVFLIRISCFGYMIMTGFQLTDEDYKNFKYKNITEIELPPERPPQDSKKEINECAKICEEIKKQKKKPGNKIVKKQKTDSKKIYSFDLPKQPCECPCTRTAQTNQLYASSIVSGQSPITAQNKMKDLDIDPGSVAIRGNQLVFKMPNKTSDPAPVEGKFASSVYYTMGDVQQEGPRNVIQILPQHPKPPPENDLTEKQDVLVLRLGKKRLAAGKKPKLELELRTPKMKEERPETESQATQYLESDIPKKPVSKKSSKPGSAKSDKKGKKGKK